MREYVRNEFAAAAHAELPEEMLDLMVNGFGRNATSRSNFFVRCATHEQSQDSHLSRRHARRILCGGNGWTNLLLENLRRPLRHVAPLRTCLVRRPVRS